VREGGARPVQDKEIVAKVSDGGKDHYQLFMSIVVYVYKFVKILTAFSRRGSHSSGSLFWLSNSRL
jgi:hypothetical protein